MIYSHEPVPGPCDRCDRCGRWLAIHAERWRRILWRLTRIML